MCSNKRAKFWKYLHARTLRRRNTFTFAEPDSPTETRAPRAVSCFMNTPEEPTLDEPTLSPEEEERARAVDREGFRFVWIGMAIFSAIIIVAASAVALVMRAMGVQAPVGP